MTRPSTVNSDKSWDQLKQPNKCKKKTSRTGLVDMAVNEREDPMRLGSIVFWVLKRGCKQMVVPGEAGGERPRPWIGLVTRGGIALQRGREVISITDKRVVDL